LDETREYASAIIPLTTSIAEYTQQQNAKVRLYNLVFNTLGICTSNELQDFINHRFRSCIADVVATAQLRRQHCQVGERSWQF
jgi:hypothetical protein